MVLEIIRFWLCDRFGCDEEDVTLTATFDMLGIHEHEMCELALMVSERFGVDIPDEVWPDFSLLEDMVGYIEDHIA